MRYKNSLLLLALQAFCLVVQAQVKHSFSEGLAAGPAHQYGREALFTDQLAYQLYNGSLKNPEIGQALFRNEQGQPVAWQAVKADTAGRFRDAALANGYLYLTYNSDREQVAVLNVSGHNMLYFNGSPRAGDMYRYGWMYLPVTLRKGKNEVYIRAGRGAQYQGLNAQLIFPDKPVTLSSKDLTLPNIVIGSPEKELWGSVVVVNASTQPLKNVQIQSLLEGRTLLTDVPVVPPMSTRKIGFRFDATSAQQKSDYGCTLRLIQKGKVIDEEDIKLKALEPAAHHSNTFVSAIDGSVQYYSVAPQQNPDGKPAALFLSVHGAEVEAISQARAYRPKDWGVLVAPTNRRPRGFNWEDWGRLDAMEVLEIAKDRYKPDPQRIYLTGHSMGGHGTWYLGATFPGQWAAIAPCAGYPSLSAYGSHDGKIPESGQSALENALLRASNPSNVFSLAPNYKAGGVYILHGDDDRVVSVDYARQMRSLLGSFHPDFSYYEYPGGSHWYGDHSVDWQPLFDYFKWHTIPIDSAVQHIDFTTANPAISASMHWASILQQAQPLVYSRIRLHRNRKAKTISGSTENVTQLALKTTGFQEGEAISLRLDSLAPISYVVKNPGETVYLYKKDGWETGPAPGKAQKGAHRNGTFKEAFNHRMVLVYGTGGSKEEKEWAFNKARYDAETWYYRANGSVDLIADKEFSLARYPDRGVVLYGNASTNSAWSKLLAKCPINVQKGSITAGNTRFTGDDLSTYFVWPRPDSPIASVAVISGSGLRGMQATEANQYFSGGSGFPDFMIFSTDMLKDGLKGVKAAGYFTNQWQLESMTR
jgi:pimeloyl-ACP methyl ester carboxylesterase